MSASRRDSLSSTEEVSFSSPSSPLNLEVAIDPAQNQTESQQPQIRRNNMYCYQLCKDFSCEGDYSSYEKCNACKTTGYAQAFGNGKVWCTRSCPTGYTDNGAPDCQTPVATNLSSWTFTSTGPWDTAYASIKCTNHILSASRGIYFNGTDSFLSFDRAKFPIHFTVSGWVLLFSSTQSQTLFVKQESVEPYRPYFNVFISSTGQLSCEIADPSFSTSEIFQDQDSDLNQSIFPTNAWEYWAVSVMMNSDAVHSTLRFIQGVTNTQSDQVTYSQGEIYFSDETEATHGTWASDGGTSFLGASQHGGNAIPDTNFLLGFIYNFHIDRGFYSQGAEELHYGNTGCIGCGLLDACTDVPTQCLRVEELSSSILEQHPPTSRKLSTECFEHCEICDGAGVDYSDCTQCKSTHWGQVMYSGYVYCTDHCPSGFIDNKPTCTAPDSTNIFSWTFTSTAGLTSNGTTVVLTGVATSPARGLYFQREHDYYIDFDYMPYSINFAISAWTYLFDIVGWTVVFAKDDFNENDTGTGNNTYLRINLRPDKRLQFHFMLNAVENVRERIVDDEFPLNAWEYWTATIKMNDDAVSSDMRFMKSVKNGGTTKDHTTTNDHLKWVDRGGKTTLGARHNLNGTRNGTNVLWGFLYNFHLDRGFYALGDAELHYGNVNCDSHCIDDVCTTVATECLEQVHEFSCEPWGGDAHCYTCYDPMCMSCTGLQADECSLCHEFTTGPTNGECSCNNARDRKMIGCFECPGECSTCLSEYTPWNEVIANCSACNAGAYDISGDSNYAYCISACPTQFTVDSIAFTCSKDQDLILQYQFDIPATTYSNQVSGSLTDLTATGGNIAIYRGYYFGASDNDAVIPVSGLVLNHSWSIHSWITIMTTGTHTVFSKDKFDYTGSKTQDQLLRCGIDSSNNLTVEWARDYSHTVNAVQLSTSVTTAAWQYVVYSFEHNVDTSSDPKTQYTEIIGVINDSVSTAVAMQNYFMNDKTEFEGYIGNSRDSSTTYANSLKGFVYDFHLYQVKYTARRTDGCYNGAGAESCWQVDFNEWSRDGLEVSGSCDSSSCGTRGCKNSDTCRDAWDTFSGIEHCNLCKDNRCILCSTYEDCQMCGSESETEAPVNNVCPPVCLDECETCYTSALDFSDCSACKTTHWEQVFNSGQRTYCTDYCPTGFVESQPACTAPVSPVIAQWNFASGVLNYSGFVVAPLGSNQTSPARGIYFADVSHACDIALIRFSIHFTVSSWVFLLDTTYDQVMFAKDDDQSTNQTYFSVQISSGGKLNVLLYSSASANEIFEDNTTVTQNSWEYWAVCVQMNIDARRSDVRIIRGVGNDEKTATATSDWTSFIDIGGKMTLGARYDTSGVLTEPLRGWIYNFFIDHGYYALGDSELHYGNTGCDAGCIDGVCTTVATECLETAYEYDCTNNGGTSDCFLCYDPMCVHCSSGLGADQCDICHDFTTGPTTGECACSSSRSNKLTRCFDCPGECATCGTGDQSPYNDVITYCTACDASAYDISNDANYAYWVSECPTQFTEGTGTCTKYQDLIRSYEFNVPLTTYSNQESVSLDLTASGGHPAIYRGYYINANDAHIPINPLILNHSWSIHAWVMIWTTPGSSNDVNTVFSKDRYDYTGSKHSEKLLRCGVDMSGNLTVEWARDKGHEFRKIQLDVTISTSQWYYVLYSFENVANTVPTIKTQHTNIVGAIGGSLSTISQSTPVSMHNYFMNDKAEYEGLIGNSRTSTSTYEQNLLGFIYNFHVYQVNYTTLNKYGTGMGCFDGPAADRCWQVNYNEWSADGNVSSGTCDSSCDTRGCRDGNICAAACDSSGGIELCNLCLDQAECISCSNYTVCDICLSGFVPEDTGCNACFEGCATCSSSTTGSYADCTACLPTHWALIFNESYQYCTDYCPTLFTGIQPLCVYPDNTNIASWTFTSTAGLTSNGLTVILSNTVPSPARGLYFPGDLDNVSYVAMDDIRLSINFTVSSWIYVFSILDMMTLIEKNQVLQTNDSYFRLAIAADARLVVIFGSGISGNRTSAKSRTTEMVSENSWEYWSIGVRMDPDATWQDIKMILGTQSTMREIRWDDTERLIVDKGGQFRLAARWATTTRPRHPLIGFIYNFHIDNGYYSLSESHYGNTGCDSACMDNVCTMVSTEWLETVHQYDCTVDGGSSDCWLCYDPMCMNCSGLGTDECDMCHHFTSLGSGECTCSSSRDSDLERCFGCPGECQTCQSDNSPYDDNITYCTQCADLKRDISDDASYKYCIDECPTTFTDNTTDCIKTIDLILSYQLDIPKSEWLNLVSGSVVWSLTATGSTGAPAIHRGYYVPDTSAQITLSGSLILNHTFSLHAWIMLATVGDNSVFSKDKYDYSGADKVSDSLLWCGIDGSGYMSVRYAKDKSPNVQEQVLDNSPLSTNVWSYLVFSFENLVDTGVTPYTQYTEFTGFINNSPTTPAQLTKFFLNDKGGYSFWAASARTSTTTYEKALQGFLYELHVYQAKHDNSNTDHYTTGQGCFDATSITNCWTVNFGKHTSEGSSEDGDCDSASCGTRGCRDADPCRASCGAGDQAFCNLCADKLCQSCDTYTTCVSGQCKVNASDHDDNCLCNDGYGRMELSPPEEECVPCPGDCATCTDASGFATCTECKIGTFKQPGNDFYVCFDTCPTGSNEDSDNKLCNETASFIINYDMTYITRPIANMVAGYSAFDGLDGTLIGTNSAFTGPLPYYLRGQYFTTNAAIQIPALIVNHVFTIRMWIRFDSVSGTQTIFSIDRNNYSDGLANCEDLLNIQAVSDTISIGLYNHEADIPGWVTAESVSGTLSAVTWYYLAVSLGFDGTHTQVAVYIDGASTSMNDGTLDGVYLEHQNGFNTIIGCEAGMLNGGSPENAFAGYIYTFKLNQTALSLASDVADDHTTSGCLGPNTCTKCPISTGNLCLWEVGQDKLERGDGSDQLCDKDNADPGDDCGSGGCRRQSDCNLCFDRLCQTCTKFDETDPFGQDSCSVCMSNASFQGTAPVDTCYCNNDFYFEEDTDSCAPCDPLCNICTDVGKKVCTDCNANAFLQENADTCLSFCPDGYTEDSNSRTCTNPPGTSKVWDLYLSSWSQDFRTVFESISSIPVTVGLTSNPTTYGSDRPWFKRSPDDRLSFLFSGDDALRIEYTDINRAGILFGSSFTIGVWARIHNDVSTQVLFSKTDMRAGATGTNADKFAFGFSAGKLFTRYVEYDDIKNSYIASSNVVSSSDADTTPYSWMLVGVSYGFVHGQTYISLAKNGNALESAVQPEQFTDILDPSEVRNIIGCQLDQSTGYNPLNFFTGDIWEVWLMNMRLTGIEITTGIDTSLLPVLDTCTSWGEYYDSQSASCVTCDETTYTADGYIEVAVNLCSSCNSALCTQCTGSGDALCTKCKSLATLTAGNCICNGSTYDDELGSCEPCDSVCDSCIGPKKFQCTTCNSTYYLNPDSYICAQACPTGTTGSSNVCTGTVSPVFIEYTFDLITKQWLYTPTSVLFHSGTDATDEPGIDALTYKQRGLYFDGTQTLLTEDSTKKLVLHHTMTLEAWIWPSTTSGSIFSKSYMDFSSAGDSDFFDLCLADFGRFELSLKADTNQQVSAITASLSTGSWNYIAVTIQHDKLLSTTLVEGYSNGFKRQATPDTEHETLAVYEKSLSDAAIGARFDGTGTKTTTNYFNGFIYHLKISSSIVDEATLNGTVETNSAICGGCLVCPSSTNECLWTCSTNEYFSGATCTSCPTCSTIPVGWDGCVREENCGLCDDLECTDCTDFSSTATCNTCLDGTTLSDCECSADRFYNIDTHTCDPCNAYCLSCTGQGNWVCTACSASNYLQEDSTFCLPFCPTGWDVSGSTCSLAHALAFHVDFTEVHAILRNKAITTTNPTINPGGNTSTPVYQRGHYFNGSDMYWTLDTSTPASVFYLHHTVTIEGWIRAMDFSQEQIIFSKNKSGTSSASQENLFLFGIRTNSKLMITIAEGSVTKATAESTHTLSNDWAFVAVRITYINPNTTQRSLIKFWVNDNVTSETETASPVWITDFVNSLTTIGAELNWSSSLAYAYFFKGYMFDLKVYNMARTDSNIDSEIHSGASCTGGCTYCPASDCISTCEIGTYGSICDPCHADCGGNCVRGGNAENCTLCDEKLCTTCEYFDSGANAKCLTCVSLAAVIGNTCSCNEGVYQASPFGCNCSTQCTKCSALDAYHCSECETGYYKQYGEDICLEYCAQGYLISGQTCAGSNQRETQRFLEIPASPAANEPQPAKDRGGYFDGTDDYVNNSIVMNNQGSVDAWIRPEYVSGATHVIFSRNINDNSGSGTEDNFTFFIDQQTKRLQLSFKTGTVDHATIQAEVGHDLTEKAWTHVGIRYNWVVDETQLQIWKNGTQIKQDQTATVPKLDNANWIGLIGAENNSVVTSAVKSNFYKGFIYEISVSNWRVTMSDYYNTSCSSYGATCSHCPASATCLPECDFNQYPDRSKSTAACFPCDESCTNGCVREMHCGLCEDIECQTCDTFTTGATCFACYPTHTQGPETDCTCLADGIFYSDVTDTCYDCHLHCETCNVEYSRQSLYDCTSCSSPGYYMNLGICEDYCPTGYNADLGSSSCTLILENPFVLHLTDFATYDEAIKRDLQNGYVAFLGDDSVGSYTTPNLHKPIMQPHAGIYFTGNSIMQLPPYGTDTSSLLLNFEHTISMTIKRNVDGSKEYLLAQTANDLIKNKYAMFINAAGDITVASKMSSVLVGGSDQDQEMSLGAFPNDGEWHVLVLKVNTFGSSSAAQTSFRSYVDGAQVAFSSVSDFYFSDNTTNTFTFGGRWNSVIECSYKGNLYDLKIYNYLRSASEIAADVLTTGTCGSCTKCFPPSACLNHCIFAQFFTLSTGECGTCLPGCENGCVRSTDCILNMDPLCGAFENSTTCDGCISLATKDTENLCQCVDNSSYDSTSHTCVCDTGLQEIVTGVCSECKNFLKASQVLYAQFESSYNTIKVKLDVSIVYDHFTSCADFVQESSISQLGTDYDCKWLEAGSLLVITLGNGATIGSEKLQLIGEKLYTSDDACPHPFEVIEPIISKITGVNPKPIAMFEINDNISTSCGDLILEGQSRNIRALDYTWSLTVDGSSFSTSQNLNSEFVRIPRNTLSNGQMTVTLSVKYLGMAGFTSSEHEADTMTKTVTIQSERALDIRFATIDTFTLNKNSYAEFPVEIRNDSCSSSTSYTYSWSLISGPSSSIGQILADSQGESKLVVRRQSLQTYGTYVFQVIASNGEISGEKLLTLTLAKPDLVAVLNIPNSEHSIVNSLTLDASNSYDPDDTSTSLSFLWSCTNGNGNLCVTQEGIPYFDYSTLQSDSYVIPANALVPDSTYNFSVEVIDGDRVSSKTVTLTTVSYDAPTLYSVNLEFRVTASKPFRIQMQTDVPTYVSFQWDQTSGISIDQSKILTPLDLPYISFAENTFSEGGDYTFTLSASYEIGTARATVDFNINKAPKWGTFFMEKVSGVEFVDVFELKALDWKDPEETDYPLKYGYKYTDDDGFDVDIRKPANDATFKTTLPKITTNDMQLILCVCDSLDACAETAKTVSITKQDEETRAATITEIINGLSISQLDDRAVLINSIPTDFELTDDQYQKILDAIRDWVANNTDDSQLVTTTAISMFQHITKFAQAKENSVILLQAATSICQTSVDGLSRDQAVVMLKSVANISTDPIDIDSVVQVIRTAAFSQTLAEEQIFDYSSSDLGITVQRTTPKRLQGQSLQPSGSHSKITLPSSGLLGQIGKLDSDESSMIDTELKEYPPFVSDNGASSSVLDFSLVEVGTYSGSELLYYEEPLELQPQNLSEEILVEIQVDNMPEGFNPQCVYASAYNETTKETTWSTEGVELDQVRPVEGVVRCKSTHLSRFTANENLTQRPQPQIETIVKKPSEDDKASDIYPIMTGFAGLLVLILVVVSLREIRQKNQMHRRTATAASDLDLTRQLKDGPVQDEVEEQTTARGGLNSSRRMNESLPYQQDPVKMIFQEELPEQYQMPLNSLMTGTIDDQINPVNSLITGSIDDPNGWRQSDLDMHENLFKSVSAPDLGSPIHLPTIMEVDSNQKIPGLVPIKTNIRILGSHLIFSGLGQNPYSRSVRTSVICTALLGEIALYGAGLVFYEGYDVFGSYNPDVPQPDYEIGREGILAGISVGIQLCISIIMILLYSCRPKAAMITNILLISVYVAGIVGLSIFYNKYWSMIWMVGSGVAAIIEILVAQTVLMIFIYGLNR